MGRSLRCEFRQVRRLVADYAAHGQRLRALHEQYVGLQDEEMSNEQGREAFLGLLNTELAVLAEAQVIKHALDGLWNEHLPAGTSSSRSSSTSLGPNRHQQG